MKENGAKTLTFVRAHAAEGKGRIKYTCEINGDLLLYYTHTDRGPSFTIAAF